MPAIFLLLTAAIVFSGYVYFNKQKNDVIRDETNQLRAFADLKAAQIRHWLDERLGDANLIAQNPLFLDELKPLLLSATPSPSEGVRIWMTALRQNYQYENVLLLDRQGRVLQAGSPENAALGREGLELLERVRRGRAAMISDLHANPEMPRIHLDIAAPLAAGKELLGFVVLRIDPASFLYPLIQSWPTPSPSAETLMVRREGDSVLFLNELRHRRGTAMTLRLPVGSPELPAAQAALGRRGAFPGRDYRGVAVWSAVRPIPGTAWSIVAKIDREEIERPVRRSAQAIFLVAVLLIFAAALLILTLWQRQEARFRIGQLESENRRQALVQHFDYLSRYANDIILLADEKGWIVEANERAILTYGLSREELLSRNLRDLRAPAERDKLASEYKRTEERLGMIFESVHVRRDGTEFPVEVSARAIDVQGKRYFQSIVRDISERRQAERALRDNEAFMRSILDNLPIGIAVNSIDPAVTFEYMNDRFPEIYRTTREKLAGPDSFWNAVYDDPAFREEIRKRVLDDCASGDPRRMVWEEIRVTRRGEEPFYISARNVPVPAKSMAISLVWDVSERKRAEDALRESEEKFKQVFETANVGKSITQLGGEIHVNQAFCAMLGYGRQELQKKRWQELTPSDEIEATQKALEPLLQGREDSARFTKRYLHKDGSFVWGDVSVAMRRDPAGRPLHFITTVVDITERKKAEEELRQAHGHIRQIIDANIVGVVIADADGRIIETNDYYLRMIGYTREEFEKGLVNWRELTPSEWLPADEKAIGELRERGRCSPYEKEYALRDGTRVPVYLADALLAGPQERIVAFAIDLTERKRSENRIRQLNEELEERVRLRTAELSDLYNNAPCGYHSLDAGGIVRMMNDTELRWLGYAREEIVGKARVIDLLTPESREIFADRFPKFKELGALSNLELTMRRKDGSSLPVLVSATAFIDARGQFVMSRSTLIDYGEQLRARDAIRESQERLVAANRELEAFSYSVSHDLRAPLRAIDGFSRIVLEEYAAKLDDEGRRLLNVIADNTKKMGRLIDDLLSFSRLSRQQMTAAPVNLAAMAKAIGAELKKQEKGRSIEFKIGALPAAQGDPAMLRQVLRNLLANAVKFTRTRARARIEFTGQAGRDETIFIVKDNGVGFDERYTDKLFGVFQRLHSTDEFEGTGVGLAIVQRIVARHGGRAWARGELGKGAAFYFSLPAKAAPGVEAPAPEIAAER